MQVRSGGHRLLRTVKIPNKILDQLHVARSHSRGYLWKTNTCRPLRRH